MTELDEFCGIDDDHDERRAVAVLVYHGQGMTLGRGLCEECARCRDCGKRAGLYDAEYCEAYCDPCAARYPAEETPYGPEIVTLDSERWREVQAELQ